MRNIRQDTVFKTLPIAGAVFFAVAALLYTALWFIQAHKAKAAVEQALQSLQGGDIRVEYAAIDTSGFPGDVKVRLHQPVFTFDMDRLLQKIGASLPVAPDGTPQGQLKGTLTHLPEWQERLSLDGTVSLSINALSDRYTLAWEGVGRWESEAADRKRVFLTQSAGQSACALEFRRAALGLISTLWSLSGPVRSGEEFAHEFRAFRCRLPAIAVKASPSGEAVMASGERSFSVEGESIADARYNIRFGLDVEGVEFFPASDALQAEYLDLLGEKESHPVPLSAYGKQSAHIDTSWVGPARLHALEGPAAFALDIRRFDIANALYTTGNRGRMENSPAGEAGGKAWKVDFRSESSIQPAYDVLAKEMVKHRVIQTLKENPPQGELLKRQTPQEIASALAALMPALSGLSPLVLAVDASYQESASSAGTLTVNKAEFNTAPYGFTASGTAARSEGSQPSGQLALACRRCPQMVTDAGNWLVRLKAVLAEIDPAAARAIRIDTAQVRAWAALVESVGQKDADGESLRFTLQSKPPEAPTINGRPLAEAMSTLRLPPE